MSVATHPPTEQSGLAERLAARLRQKPQRSLAERIEARLRPSRPQQGRFLSGGPISDVFDILSVGEYAVGGLLSGKGILQGIAERTASAPEFRRLFRQAGMPEGLATSAAAFVASLVVDPINLVGVGLPGRALRAVGARAAAEAIESAAPKVARAVSDLVVPAVAERVPAVARALRRAEYGRRLEPIFEAQRIREAQGAREALEAGKQLRAEAMALTGNAKDVRRLDESVGLYINVGADTLVTKLAGGATLEEARAAAFEAQKALLQGFTPRTREFVERWAKRIAEDNDRLGEQLVRLKMLRPETLEKWRGLHLRVIYERFEDPEAFIRYLEEADPETVARVLIRKGRAHGPAVGPPIPTGVTKGREIVGERRREALGAIKPASSRYIVGRTLEEQAIARGEAYQKIAQEFAVDPTIVLSDPQARQWFRQIEPSPVWGALAGKWLPKEIADILIDMQKKPEGLEKFLETVTRWWKFSKVVLNPSTHLRNMRTNVSLAHNAAGLGALNPLTWMRAVREVLTNGPALREAQQVSSAFVDTFVTSEALDFARDLSPEGIVGTLKKIGATASRLYQMEEQVAKMAVYLTVRSRGLSPQAAAKAAELALFDYRKVPRWVDKARRWGVVPFLVFPYKVATQTLPQIIRRPGRMAQQVRAIRAVSEPLTEEERRALPPHLRSGGYIKLPIKVNGHPVLFDLTYELIFGDLGEAGTPISSIVRLLSDPTTRWRDVAPTLTQFLTPLGQVAAELALNRSALTGREIVREGELPARAYEKRAIHAARWALPAWAGRLLPGGLLHRSITQTPSPSGEPPQPLPQALATTLLGLRTIPLDVRREQLMRILELRGAMRDIQDRIRSTAREAARGALSREEARARILAYYRQMQQLMRQYRQEGMVTPP